MITVKLTLQENIALELAGNAIDEDVENVIFVQLAARGIEEPKASASANQLAKAALSARTKIREATAYTIEVSDDE